MCHARPFWPDYYRGAEKERLVSAILPAYRAFRPSSCPPDLPAGRTGKMLAKMLAKLPI